MNIPKELFKKILIRQHIIYQIIVAPCRVDSVDLFGALHSYSYHNYTTMVFLDQMSIEKLCNIWVMLRCKISNAKWSELFTYLPSLGWHPILFLYTTSQIHVFVALHAKLAQNGGGLGQIFLKNCAISSNLKKCIKLPSQTKTLIQIWKPIFTEVC